MWKLIRWTSWVLWAEREPKALLQHGVLAKKTRVLPALFWQRIKELLKCKKYISICKKRNKYLLWGVYVSFFSCSSASQCVSSFVQKSYFAAEFLELKPGSISQRSLQFNTLVFYLYFNDKTLWLEMPFFCSITGFFLPSPFTKSIPVLCSCSSHKFE